MRRGGLASPRSLTIRRMATRREPRDFDRTNPISARGRMAQRTTGINFGSRSTLQIAAPNEPNLGSSGDWSARAGSLFGRIGVVPLVRAGLGRPASQAIRPRRTRSSRGQRPRDAGLGDPTPIPASRRPAKKRAPDAFSLCGRGPRANSGSSWASEGGSGGGWGGAGSAGWSCREGEPRARRRLALNRNGARRIVAPRGEASS